MKVSRIATIRVDEHLNLLWIQVHTDNELTGLGKTFFMPRTVEAYFHEVVVLKLLGSDPLVIDQIAKNFVGYLGFASTGAEMRSNSAVDIALWNLFGKATNQPVAQLPCGFSRQWNRTYNTCAGTAYMRDGNGQRVSNYGLGGRALAPYATFWHEDPIEMDSLGSLKRYADASPAPLCASETLATRWAFHDLLETGAAGVVMLDLSWCSGLSEARKIAAMAEAWHLPVAPHDCTGPVVLAASTHLALNAPNALAQESVRAYYRTWYRDLVTQLPEVRDGMITLPPGPGFGLDLSPDLDRLFTVTRREAAA